MDKEAAKEEHCIETISADYEETCWGCGLRILLPSYLHIFKCGWCGAITNQNQSLRIPDSPCFSRWRRIRDGSFVAFLTLFILFVICAGVWAIYPIIFSNSYFCGIFHCTVIAILCICTISSFCLAAFKSPGASVKVSWGSYSIVAKDALENYTFCVFCARPKPPRAHHCRSCRMCVLDMDHHCPFIGNCVGAANHRAFIAFLISIVISCIYLFVMTSFAAYRMWPPVDYRGFAIRGVNVNSWRVLKQIIAAFASSALLLSARSFVLVYLAFASISVESGIIVLLWQQLRYIYEGNTYISHISSTDNVHRDKGCHNLLRFFGCPYSFFRFILGPANAAKLLESESSKLL